MAHSQQQLAALLDVQDLVTFRWYAQQMDVPVEEAKAQMEQFADANPDEIQAIYLLGGSLKPENDHRRR